MQARKLQFDYTIEYSSRKRLLLEVSRDTQLIVKAPFDTPIEVVEAAIEKKKLWIYQKMQHPQKYALNTPRKELKSGETFEYLGKNYKLKLIDEEGVFRFKNRFYLSANLKATGKELFVNWYQTKAREKMEPLIGYYANLLGVQYDKILVSDLRFRWGSCTPKKNLNFNWRLIKAPHFVLNYIIVHELVHLIEPNHSPRFWDLVAITYPKYEEAKEWLKRNGQKLEISFL
jgi:hypothetical protein